MPRDVFELLHKATQLLKPSQREHRLCTNVLNESAQARTDLLEKDVMTRQTDSMTALNGSEASFDLCLPSQLAL